MKNEEPGFIRGLLTAAAVVLLGSSCALATTSGIVKGFYGKPTNLGAAQFPFQNQVEVGVSYGTLNHSSGTPSATDLDVSNIPQDDPLPLEGLWYYMIYGAGGSGTPSFTWSHLTPNADYRVSIYSYEGYYDGSGRTFYVQFNGVRATTCRFKGVAHDGLMIPWTDAGNKKNAPCRYDFEVQADENGELAVALEKIGDNAQFTSAVLYGSSAPSEPSIPTVVKKPGTAEFSVAWEASVDALAYYVERSLDGETWTTVGRTVGQTIDDPIVSSESDVRYRIVASNGVGKVTGEAALVPVLPSTLVRYAFNLGTERPCVGRFVPAHVDQFKSVAYASTATVTGAAPADYLVTENIYRTYVMQRKLADPLVFRFDGLAPGETYSLRLHTIEPATDVGEGVRVAAASVNGVKVADVDARKLAGAVRTPTYAEFDGTADADGVIELTFASANDAHMAVLCAVEVLEPEGASKLPTPKVRVVETADFLKVVPETAHAMFKYEIQYADADPGNGSGQTFVSAALAAGVVDLKVASGATRWYRARASYAGLKSDWSTWVFGTRGGRSAYAPLRIYFAKERTKITPPEGWVWDGDYRVDPLEYPNSDVRTDPDSDYDLSGVSDPAPVIIYKTYLANNNDNKGTNYVHRFGGFDPAVTYRLRLHVVETYFTADYSRIWDEAVNGICDSASPFYRLSPFGLAKAKMKAAVAEYDVRPDLCGVIQLTAAYRINENFAQYRGLEILPLDAPAGRGACRTAIYAKTGETVSTAEACELVTERAEATLAWDSSTLPPEASESPRIDSHGYVYAPAEDAYSFSFAANGRVRLWIDGSFLFEQTMMPGTPVKTPEIQLSEGPHEYHLEYMPTTAASCAFSANWSCPSLGDLGSLGDSLMAWADPIGVSDWRLFRLGESVRPPSFVLRRGTGFRLYGSGSDIYGGTDEGTFLFRKAKRGFTMTFRIKAVGGENVHATSTRFGVEVRSLLDSPKNRGFAMYSGVSVDGTFRAYADTIINDECKMVNDVDPWKPAALYGFKPICPCYIRVTRQRLGGGNWRYVFSYSRDGVDWVFSRTQDIAKATAVYVGPTVCAYTGDSHCGDVLAWMDIDEISFEEEPIPGALIIYR